jgi:glutamate carboxypeptidase
MLEQIIKDIDSRTDQTIDLLGQLVNIDSSKDCFEGNAQVARIIGENLAEAKFEVEYLTVPGVCTHVLANKKGTGDKNIMIIGHLDTVFKKGTAKERPFTIKEGKAYGPGVLDMKSGVVIAISALKALDHFGWNGANITVFFAGDEETRTAESRTPALFLEYGKEKDAVFNMETGSDAGTVVIGRKGVMRPTIHVTGKATHAGKDPQKGASAVLELAKKIVDLHALTDYESGITYNVGVISGGTVANAVAAQATGMIDIRFMTVAQSNKALEDLLEIASRVYVPGTSTIVDETGIGFMPMETTEEGLRLFETVRQQGVLLGIEPEIEGIVTGGGSDACWTVMAGSPSICGMGARGELNHGKDEYICLDSLDERAKLLAFSMMAV